MRAAGRTWALAAAVLGILGSVRAVPPIHNGLYLAALAAVAGLLAWGLRVGRRRLSRGPGAAVDASAGGTADTRAHHATDRPADTVAGAPGALDRPDADRPETTPAEPPVPLRRTGRGAVYAGAAGGVAVLLPWLWVGALGGPLETLLAGAAAGAVAILVADLLGSRVTDGPWAVPGPYLGDARTRSVLLAGLVGGVALVPIAAGAAGSGPHLALMLFTPALGFAAAALARSGQPRGGWLFAIESWFFGAHGFPADYAPLAVCSDSPVVIEARGVHKTFRIPTHRIDSLKERATHPFTRVEYREHRAADV